MTFNTGNPIGSTDARDLSDNAENFDKALGTLESTWVDRFGVTRDSFEGRLEKGSFYRVGTFSAGYTLTNMRQALEYDGHEYSWAGNFPKVVAAGATPASSGGIGAGAWVDRTDVTLRSELAAVGSQALIAGRTAEAVSEFPDRLAEANSNEIVSGELARSIADNSKFISELRTATPIRNFKEIAKQRPFNIEEFKQPSSTYWDQALADVLSASNTYGNGIEFGAGQFSFSAPQTLLFPTEAGAIRGKGIGKTMLLFPNASAGETQFYLTSQNGMDWYDLIWEGMSLHSSHDGTLVKLGRDNYSDPLNCASLRNVAVLNSKAAAENAEALRLNYVVNSEFSQCRANGYANGAGANYGRALNCRQAAFNVFNGGSYGNAADGISFRDGISFGNVFNAIDVENVGRGVFHASTGGRNTFVGGQFSLWTDYLLTSQAGDAIGATIELINPNISSTTDVINPTYGLGVRISGVQWDAVTPSIGASGAVVRNTTGRTVMVNVWGGTVSMVAVNAVGVAVQSNTSFMLKPWDTIAISYSSAPSWIWNSVS